MSIGQTIGTTYPGQKAGTINNQFGAWYAKGQPMSQDLPVLEFGVAVAFDADGKCRATQIGDTHFAGVCARPFPDGPNQGDQSLDGPERDKNLVTVLSLGAASGKVGGAGAAVNGDLVFVWNQASAGSHVLGWFETSADDGAVPFLRKDGIQATFGNNCNPGDTVDICIGV